MITIYRLVNCEMFIHGPGTGYGPDRKTALCLLPLNAYNELAFLGIWMWLVTLGILTLLHICILMAISCNISFRAAIIKRGLNSNAKKCVTNLLLATPEIGPWFNLYLVKRNTDDLTFAEFVLSAGKDL